MVAPTFRFWAAPLAWAGACCAAAVGLAAGGGVGAAAGACVGGGPLGGGPLGAPPLLADWHAARTDPAPTASATRRRRRRETLGAFLSLSSEVIACLLPGD